MLSFSNLSLAANWNQGSTKSVKVDDMELRCEFTQYSTSGYKEATAKSWVRPSQTHIFKGAGVRYPDRADWGSGLITLDNAEQTKWQYEKTSKDKQGRKAKTVFKYMFFKSNKRIAASVEITGYNNINNIWGQCSKNDETSVGSSKYTFVKNGDDLYVDENDALSRAIALTRTSQPAASEYLEKLFGGKPNTKYFEKGKNKALVGAFPISCNYRYAAWDYDTVELAFSRASSGCKEKMNKYNELMGKNCKCRIAAINDTLFLPTEFYHGELGYVPMIALVEQNGDSIQIKGTVEWESPGASRNPFRVKNEKDVEICTGYFDIKSKAKGDLTLDCFDGKFRGSGQFINSGFDAENRFFNGTAIINLSGDATMKVVYGKDAL